MNCANCGSPIQRSKKQIQNSKSKLFFCSKKCQHNNSKYNKSDYRSLALENKEHVCEECGWKDFSDILEVHHVDFNHGNNDIDNLSILCPNCHRLAHWFESGKAYMDQIEPLFD